MFSTTNDSNQYPLEPSYCIVRIKWDNAHYIALQIWNLSIKAHYYYTIHYYSTKLLISSKFEEKFETFLTFWIPYIFFPYKFDLGYKIANLLS